MWETISDTNYYSKKNIFMVYVSVRELSITTHLWHTLAVVHRHNTINNCNSTKLEIHSPIMQLKSIIFTRYADKCHTFNRITAELHSLYIAWDFEESSTISALSSKEVAHKIRPVVWQPVVHFTRQWRRPIKGQSLCEANSQQLNNRPPI